MSYFKGIHLPCRTMADRDYLDVVDWGPEHVDVRAIEGVKTSVVRLNKEQARELAKRLSAWAGKDAPIPPKPWSDL